MATIFGKIGKMTFIQQGSILKRVGILIYKYSMAIL